MSLHTRTLGEGPDLVMIHGWSLHSGVFDSVVPALSRTWRVTLVDLPGHGQSRDLPLETDLSRVAARIAAAVPSRAVWLGWSLGGLAAMQHAIDRPDAPRGLILVATTPRFPAQGPWPGIDPATLQAFARGLENDYLATLRRFLALQVQGCADHAQVLRRLREQMLRYPAPSSETLAAGLTLLRDTDLRPRLGRIARPVFIIYGERDRIVPPQAAAALCRRLPGARAHCLKGAGHAPFLSHPDAFLKIVDAMIDET